MKELINILERPFREIVGLFFGLWLFISAADCFFWSIHGNPIFGVYMALHGLIVAYVLSLLCSLLPKRGRTFTEWLLLVTGVVNLVIDTFVHNTTHIGFTNNMVAIIMGTNANEATEFLKTYLNWGSILFVICVIALFFLIMLFSKKMFRFKKWFGHLLLLFVFSCIGLVSIRKSRNWEGLYLMKIYSFLSYRPFESLLEYRQSFNMEILGAQPQHIVVIIGESSSKKHYSLYGYSKPTTPRLDAMFRDSLLLRYDNAKSGYTTTAESFKRMMSSVRGWNPGEIHFDKEYLLMDLTSSSGYKNWWISNQRSHGIYDNVVYRFAELCDETVWIGPKYLGNNKQPLDEELLPAVQDYLKVSEGKNFLIINMMGSHEAFEDRYPQEFQYFTENDYLSRPHNQRKSLADYDNSITYTDFVVTSIMHYFDDEEAIILFFPDHSMDIFDTDPDYAGHARMNNQSSVSTCLDIPFIIYCTDLYINHFSDEMVNLSSSSETPFNTEDLPILVMELMNARIRE